MTRDYRDLERLAGTQLLRVNPLLFGIVLGFLGGLILFLATNWLVLKGGHVGPHLSLLSQFLFGYRVTFLGSLVGFAYAFVIGMGMGSVGAWLYNRVSEMLHGPQEEPRSP